MGSLSQGHTSHCYNNGVPMPSLCSTLRVSSNCRVTSLLTDEMHTSVIFRLEGLPPSQVCIYPNTMTLHNNNIQPFLRTQHSHESPSLFKGRTQARSHPFHGVVQKRDVVVWMALHKSVSVFKHATHENYGPW